MLRKFYYLFLTVALLGGAACSSSDPDDDPDPTPPSGGNETVLIGQKMQKFQNIVIIIHRFPSAHDYHIGDPLPRQSCDGVNLIQHLRRT